MNGWIGFCLLHFADTTTMTSDLRRRYGSGEPTDLVGSSEVYD